MNRGDAGTLILEILINDEPIDPHYADDIELTFNPELHGHCVSFSLSKGTIYWEDELQKYVVIYTQEDTFTLKPGVNTWQLRVLREGMVISNTIEKFNVGDVNSKRVLVG